MAMASRSTKIGHTAAKFLGIKLDPNGPPDIVTRGESAFSVPSADTYVEPEPTSVDWIRENVPDGRDVFNYFRNLLPFTRWITRYNVQWLTGDLIAGITVGAVVVPQSMAYAKLAELPVEFGLYSSFMGVLIYWFFATSKDITIGPVAVLSTVTGNIVLKANAQLNYPDDQLYHIASAAAIIGGAIVAFLGFTRLGFIVEFISLTSIAAFLTGSAINIAVGQVPTLMGITGFDTRASTYKVVINVLKHLGRTKMDAAVGLTALLMLYLWRSACTHAGNRMPARKRLFFFISTLRTVFVILLYTLISWLVNRHRKKNPLFKVLGKVPRGFKHAGAPKIDTTIIKTFASDIPALVIVLLIEHISISKSFGRVNNYKIDPSQEMVAIGVTNLLGPLLGAYPATGSFSRTAIKSKAGVRTPFAGVITSIVVLLAIYALPAVFFYIPSAPLSAVIIHAVGDLITPPNTLYQFWRINPLEVFIWFAGVLVTVFSSIENGIYVTICVSAGLLLFRLVKARGRFMGKVTVHSVIGDHLLENEESKPQNEASAPSRSRRHDPDEAERNMFLPIDHHDGSNPAITVTAPYPGVFIYRFSEGYNYPNANHYLDDMVETIFQETRRTNLNSYGRPGDRPWNDPGPRRGKAVDTKDDRPTLKAVILDFSSVNNVDVTSVQNLIDVRNQLDRYASPEVVEWHFACINNRWTKRALVSAGFGYPTPQLREDGHFQRWKPVYSVAEFGAMDSAAAAAEWRDQNMSAPRRPSARDVEAIAANKGGDATADQIGSRHTEGSSDEDSLEKQLSASKAYGTMQSARQAVVHSVNRPLFHMDLTSALQSAIGSAKRKEALEQEGGLRGGEI